MRILMAGMLAGDPHNGGATWAILQYLHGLARLGHEVLVVEPVSQILPDSVRYLDALALGNAALLVRGSRETYGLPYSVLAGFNAELLLNVSGMLDDPELTSGIRTRVFLDLDPAFCQVWLAQGAVSSGDHTHFVTVGTRVHETNLPLDRDWLVTLPPVMLSDWPLAERLEYDAFTTVGHWRSYGNVHYDGRVYGQRAHSLRRLVELPRMTRQRLLPALAIHPGEAADLATLREYGWRLLDPAVVAATPEDYRRFVAGSKGELGLAKAGYVDSRCGWFSDRSACYLASGRPVVAQATGFEASLPVGEGLLTFDTATAAAAALDAVASDYERHRRAARALAEEHFDSDRVLARLLESVV
jgi:hypothetical protein